MAECNSRTAKKILRHLIKYQKLCKEEDYNYLNAIRRELEMSPQAVSDGINVLLDLGIICDIEKTGKKKVIYVTPDIVDQANINKEQQKQAIGELI